MNWVRDVTSRPARVNMRGVSDDVTARLKRAVRGKRRADKNQEQWRNELREAILAASKDPNLGTSKITALIDHEYTEAHVSRIINGKA